MQMKVIITFCPHSSSSDVLEAQTFSSFSWATMKHEASSTNQIYQIAGNEEGVCVKVKEAAWAMGMVKVSCSQFPIARDAPGLLKWCSLCSLPKAPRATTYWLQSSPTRACQISHLFTPTRRPFPVKPPKERKCLENPGFTSGTATCQLLAI